MTPGRRLLLIGAALAVVALVVPLAVVVAIALAVAGATVVDALIARRPPLLTREAPTIISRGVTARLRVDGTPVPGTSLRVRQPVPAGMSVEPWDAGSRLDADIVGRRRGRFPLPPAVARATGPLGLARWDHRAAGEGALAVYPDLVKARRLASTVRQGRLRGEGRLTRGPLGLGTEFEAVRDYNPDDDIRQVNWRATARVGRPMSNQYRVDQDRDVVCMIDMGRLMTAPVGDHTRLDIALDACTAVAMVADEVGDRCGCVAFDRQVRRRVTPRRAGGRAVIDATFDLVPSTLDSDYELAFRLVAGAKRALVLVLTDLLDEAAARSLTSAVPVLARRHAVVVASVADPDIDALAAAPPSTAADVYAAAVALEMQAGRAAVAATLTAAGATVVEAPPDSLSWACVTAYLRQKRRARL
ncbi:MAG: hypothetical protein QOG64_2877 [Acidimicrobiaceae bacterium]|jgi:uncharacterized protein (DUF58 family)|nr:hypothetical protein [Acidimicrobiaceae bacterium]